MGDINVDGDCGEVDGDGGGGDGVDGDGSGGTYPSRQGAGTETSVPRNWSSMGAALQNFTGKNAKRFRVFAMEALYRQRCDVRGQPWPTHHRVARPRGHLCHQVVWWPLTSLRLSFGLRLVSGKIGGLGFVLSNSKNISYVTFMKHKTAENREMALWHLVNRLVLENA
jgi:hypothetical protein